MKGNLNQVTTLDINESYEGESIEEKVDRIVNNNEPISDSAPLIFTERSQGVLAETDIRTDTMDIAVEKMSAAAASKFKSRLKIVGENPISPEGSQTVEPTK